MEELMDEEKRKAFLDESHERAVRQAISAATDDLVRHSQDRKSQEKSEIEARFDNIEHRLKELESTKK